MSFPDFTESVKDCAYLGSAKRKTPPPQRGQECQLKQCNSKASDNRFSMTSTTLSTDSVYEWEKCVSEIRKRLQTGENSLIREFKLSYKTIFTGLVAPPNLFPSSSLKLMSKMMNWQCETPTCPMFQEAYRKMCRLKQFYSKARSWFHSGGKSASLYLQTDFEWWKSAG